MGLMKRCKMAFRKIINSKDIDDIIKKNEKSIDKVIKEIDKRINDYYINVWKSKKSARLIMMLENKFVDKKLTIQAWKLMNIKRNAFLQIIRMQENTLYVGLRKATILRDEQYNYCFYCKDEIAIIPHILLACKIGKKNQINRHDYVCKEIYKKIIKNYCKIDDYDRNNFIPICITTKDQNITIMYNKDIISKRTMKLLARRPDIYIENTGQRKGYIIDVTIVKDEKLETAYYNKLKKYRNLHEHLRNDRNLNLIITIPVVITIDGFIHCKSVNLLNDELKLKFEFDKILKNTLINEMKDLLYYITGESPSQFNI